MAPKTGRFPVVLGLALALLAPLAAQAAGGQEAQHGLAPRAVAFIQALASGHYETAEEGFTDQMKQAAPPAALRELWQKLVGRFGPFQGMGDSRTVVQDGFTSVVVSTDFKRRALGLAVTFDSAQRIAGMHIVPPP
jgi:hypothetical protein